MSTSAVSVHCTCFFYIQARLKAEEEAKKKEEKEMRRALARQRREELRLAQQVHTQ